MITEVERGVSPASLTAFLRRTFPRRGPWWWTRLLGPLPDAAYAVKRIVPFDDGEFFVRSCVFYGFAPAGLLEAHALPAGGSYGLFALSRDGVVSYLTRHREAAEGILGREDRALDEGDSFALARFFTEALDRKGNSSGDVLRSADSLPGYTGGHGGLGGGYVLDAAEWTRVKSQVLAPVILGNSQSGWRLEYCIVYGWAHEKKVLSRHRIDIDPEFRISKEETVLSPKIFSRTPGILY
jgi:hypothetical protein